MKLLKTFFLSLFLLSFQSTFCADANIQDPLFSTLTDTQEACFNWFETNKQILKSLYNSLSDEEKNVIRNKILYKDNPQAVTTCLTNYVKSFYKYAQEKNIELKYDEHTALITILKMKIAMQYNLISNPRNLTEARMKVFSQLLTKEEQSTVLEQNYLADPHETYKAMTKNGQLLAIEAVKLGIIENNDQAKEKFATEFRDKKMKALKHAYDKDDFIGD